MWYNIKGKYYPLETKSGHILKSASLKRYDEKYNPELLIRTSMNNLSLDGKVLNIQVLMLDHLINIIDIAIK